MRQLGRIVLCAVVAAGCAGPGAVATAAPKTTHTKSVTRTFTLSSGATKSFDVGYPFALKYAHAKYRGKVQILAPAHVRKGQLKPRLAKVKVLSKGSALGGSDYRVKVKNGNVSGAAAVRVRVTATTTWTR
jgi:hypothetical protein